jgi:hypothetical protein
MDWLVLWLQTYRIELVVMPALVGIAALLGWFPGHNAFWHNHPRYKQIRVAGWACVAAPFGLFFTPVAGPLILAMFIASYLGLTISSFGNERRRTRALSYAGFEVWRRSASPHGLMELAGSDSNGVTALA